MSHACLISFPVLYQLARSVGLKGTEYRNTFFICAFHGQLWNIKYSRSVIDSKVKTFHHTALNQSVHEEVIPASLLCQQIAFKLTTAFSFEFQQDTFFFISRCIDEHISDMVMLRIFVMPVIFMEHIVDIQFQNIFDNVLYIHCGKTDTHIIEQQKHRIVWIEFLHRFQQFLFHALCQRYRSCFDTA